MGELERDVQPMPLRGSLLMFGAFFARASLDPEDEALTSKLHQTLNQIATLRERAQEIKLKLKDVSLGEENAFDWTQCKSEGGGKQCASCTMLPCDKVEASSGMLFAGAASLLRSRKKDSKSKYSSCPDDKIWKGAFFIQYGSSGQGHCNDFTHDSAIKGVAMTSFRFPTVGNTSAPKGGNLVLTKSFVTHPNKASKNVGMFMFKRLVTHLCTGKTKACKKGQTVADVMKVGYCVNCDKDVFGSIFSESQTHDEKKTFAKDCIPKAFKADGKLKSSFKCSDSDMQFARASLAGF